MKILKALFPKRLLGIGFGTFLLGTLAILQYRSIKPTLSYKEQGELLALKVSKQISETTSLREEVASLEEKLKKLSLASTSSITAEEAVKESIEEYKIFAGESKVSGPGVIITVRRKLEENELVDLINILRSLGAEAISINDGRILIQTPLDPKNYPTEFKILAIGSPTLLSEGLKKKDGILDQINKSGNATSVETAETLTLPATTGKHFNLGKPIES